MCCLRAHCRASLPLSLLGADTFKVSTTNDVGTGPESVASVAVTPAAVPTAPTITSVRRGDQQVTVTFTAANGNGNAVDLYTAVATPGGMTASGNTLSLTISSLTNGQDCA